MLGLARLASSHDAHKATARTLMRTLGKSLRRAPKAFGARFGKAFGARPHPATKTKRKLQSWLAARQRVLFCEKMNLDP